MNYFQTDDQVQLYYEYHHAAVPNAKTIVFIHGAGLNSSFFHPLVPGLSINYNLLIYDLRDHGQSGDSSSSISWELLCHDLLELLEHLQLTSVILAGHGVGANIAAKFVLEYEAYVDCLIFFAPPIYLPSKTHQKDLEVRKSLLEAPTLKPLGEYLLQWVTARNAEAEIAEQIVHAYERLSKEKYLEFIQLSIQTRPVEELQLIHRPALVLSGELDPFYTPAINALSCSLLKQASLFILPDASNMMFLDQPSSTSERIHAFILRTEQSTGWSDSPYTAEINESIRKVLQAGYKMLFRGPNLTIRCLDGFEVAVNGRVLNEGWNKRYAKNILLYLSFHPVTLREDLCDALFPEVETKVALTNLRVYLSHFLKLLEGAGSDSPCVILDRDVIRLNLFVDSDVHDFLKELRQAEAEAYEPIRYNLCKYMLHKVSSSMLSGFFDPFALSVHDEIASLWEHLAIWCANYCCRLGKMDEAVTFLSSCLVYFPQDEGLMDRIIAIYEQTDNKKELAKWKRKKKNITTPV
ncbi:alpha/beta hydrolase [Paenibacillus cremeus]|uniref:Alpha/beta fold hydrolase n=1 Tax=Paenibacillus cremeus TaxID=2163881 RepID=A0A559KE20_9BACL|nr:alpha/beta hydrolase [Paenibacillus cremeus]TVY10371.1 alpha/beta fold hydrolase [Paenibacillus cremeus]